MNIFNLKHPINILFIIVFVSFILFLFAIPVLAESFAEDPNVELQVPLFGYAKAQNIAEYIKVIFKYALYIIIPIAVLMIMYSGGVWIFAAGNTSKIKDAKKHITSAVLGLIIAALSYIILSLVGITELKLPGIERVEPMAIPVEDGEFDTLVDIADTMGGAAGSSGAPPVAGEMPRIFQCDYRNVKFNCASKSVCSSGCGTVSVTMVLRYWGKNISIEQAVQHMASAKAIGCSISGTSPSGFASIAKANGLKYNTVPVNFEGIKNYVANKKPIIANVGNRGPGRTCKFTAHGHYIVLSGWDAANNRFIVNDPGGRSPNRFNGTWNELASGCIFKGAYYVGN